MLSANTGTYDPLLLITPWRWYFGAEIYSSWHWP